MATMAFETGVPFRFRSGYGLCLRSGRCLIITGSNDDGYHVSTRREIPNDVQLVTEMGIPGDIYLAFTVARILIAE